MKIMIKNLLRETLENADNKIAVGLLIKCSQTNNIFLLLRNDNKPRWSLMSGGIDDGESPLNGLIREIKEELSIDASIIDIKHIRIEVYPEKKLDFHYYEGLTNEEFIPTLDNENLNWGWFDKKDLPTPLFKGLAERIQNI